jgi:hypothetical protein
MAVGVLIAGYRSLTTTTVIVTRHAEKVLGTIADAPLTPEGEQRAQQLARTFGGTNALGRIDAIYVVNQRSALMTAVPLASRLRLQPILLTPGEMRGIGSRILRAHRGRAVLLIGQNDSVTQLVRSLSGIAVPPVAEEDYGSAYVVSVPSVGSSNILEIKY